MKPKISIITLGVSDFDRSVEFYRDKLGFPVHGDADNICFMPLHGTWLSLYPRNKLAEDAEMEPGEATAGAFPGFTLAHNVSSKEEVDQTLEAAVTAGATLVKAAEEVFWGGYSGYFADPDGFLWEVAYNPFTDLT